MSNALLFLLSWLLGGLSVGLTETTSAAGFNATHANNPCTHQEPPRGHQQTRLAAAEQRMHPGSPLQPTPTKLRDLLPEGALGFAVIDLETTHLGVKQARIVEIAITLIDPKGRIERWHSLVNPELAITNSHIHGISDAMVTPAPSFSALAPTIGTLLDGRVLVARNLRSFDRPILENCYARCGVGNFDPGDGIDTMPSPRLNLKKLLRPMASSSAAAMPTPPAVMCGPSLMFCCSCLRTSNPPPKPPASPQQPMLKVGRKPGHASAASIEPWQPQSLQ